MRGPQILIPSIAAFAVFTLSAETPAFAGSKRVKAAHPVERDCTPINGRFGYYGNPWCDTGSYRQEDVEFRERHKRRLRIEDGGQR